MKLTLTILLLSIAVAAQTQSPSGTPQHVIVDSCTSGCGGGAGGGGLAQLQVRNAGDTAWVNVGFNVANLFLPVVLQTGSNTIGAISNSGFNVNNFPATYDTSDRAARLLGHVTVDSAPSTAVTGTFWPYSLGQQLAGASVPIVLTASQLTTLTPPAAFNGVLAAGSAVIGHVIVDTAPSTAVTNVGTFATQATLAAETTKVIGTVNVAAAQTIGLAAGSAVIGHVINDASSAVIGHVISDSGSVTNATLSAETTKVIGTVNVAASQTIGVTQATPANLQATVTQQSITKGTQGTTGVTTQDLKDSGRSRVTFTADRVTPAASDTLVTFVKDVAGTSTTAQTTYTVTTGKTFRVQSFAIGAANSTTTALSVRVALRENTGGTCTASSAPVAMLNTATPAAVAAEGSSGVAESFPDGLEFPAADSICFSAIGSTSTGTLTATVVGFEY